MIAVGVVVICAATALTDEDDHIWYLTKIFFTFMRSKGCIMVVSVQQWHDVKVFAMKVMEIIHVYRVCFCKTCDKVIFFNRKKWDEDGERD